MLARSILVAGLMAVLAGAATAQVVTQNYNSMEFEWFDASNDIPMTAGPLLSGGTNAPSYYQSTDVDYYHINVANVPSTITVRVEGAKSMLFGDCDPTVWIEDDRGNALIFQDDIAFPVNLDCFIQYVFTTPGDYYVGSEPSFLTWNPNVNNYYMSGTYQFVDVDTIAPTYDNAGGVRSAMRLGVSQTAAVFWYPATDNVTPASEMKYNVYRATTSGAVFSGPAVASFTGVLGGKVGGLSSDTSTRYWFGVRAEDAAGNEEANTRVVEMSNPLAVPPSRWMLYR